jgi:pectate disaccharide-lyase
VFSGNKSVRTQQGLYDDAVVGNIAKSNYFIVTGKSVNGKGELLPDGASLITQR